MPTRAPDWRDALLTAQQSAFAVVDPRSGVVLRVGDPFAAGVETAVHDVRFDGEPAVLVVVEADQARRLERMRDELAEFPRTNPGPVLRLSREGRVELANEAAGRLFGRETLDGEFWPDLCEGVTGDVWAEVIRTQGQVTHETTVGDHRMSFAHVFRPVREVVFVYGTDVTTLRRQEEQLAEMARFPDMNPGPVLRLDLEGTVLLSNAAARDLLPEVIDGSNWLQQGPGVDVGFWLKVLDTEVPIPMEATIGDRNFQFTHRLDPGRHVFVYGADITAQKAAESAARDSERLATLGTLAAGVTHELNNPAAAARRASAHLAEALTRMRRSAETLIALGLSTTARTAIVEFEQAANSGARGTQRLTAMERADLEDEIDDWMSAHGPADGTEGDFSAEWVRLGFGCEDLKSLSARVGDSLPAAVERIAAVADVDSLVLQVGRSTERVSEIALALKRYTYLGQAEVLDVDIHQGLEDTLLLLGHKLAAGTHIRRDYADEPMTVWGIGSELNQVWMNLIDNAIDAAGPEGSLVLRTRSVPRLDGMCVQVDVEDDGPGVPEEVQSRVFEPFFTTKAPGSGTGLGLATSWSIVVDRHHGSLAVTSQPQRTVFTVILPVSRAATSERGGP